jgi:hypothetical protein
MLQRSVETLLEKIRFFEDFFDGFVKRRDAIYRV